MKNPFERYSRLEDVVVVLKKIQETPSEKRIGSDTILDEPAENIVPLTVSKQPKIAYKKVAVLFSIILIAVLVFTFYDKIPTSFVTEKPIDKIVVSISINDGSVKIDKPIVKDIIEFLFQEKMLRSSREKILSGEEFRRLENESSEFKLLPKLAVKGSLSKSKIGYEFEMSIEQNGKRVKDTSITFNDPATFLNNELSPLTAMVLNSKKIKILRDVPITDNWDAIENFVMGSKAWGKLDKIIAKKAVEKALALDPKFTLAKLKYLEIVKFEGDIQQSKLLLAEIYKEIGNLNYIDSVRTLALDNSLKGFYRKAISNYKEIKEYLPQNKNSSYDIAETYYEIRSIDDAIKYYHEALEKDSNFTPAINHLAYCYLDKLEIEKAMYYFTKYIELDPSGNAFDSMADGFFAAGMIDSALSYKLAGIQLDPSLDYLHSSVGLFYAIKGDYKNADSAFSIYADLVNDNPELSTGASFYKAFNEYFAGNLGPAEEIIDASISKINKDSLLGSQQNYWLKGLILFDKGNYDELKNIISIFEKNIKKFRISKEDYHPIYKFYVHLSILKAISEKNKDKIKEFMEILNSDIKFKIKDNGSVFDHAFLSYNLYKVFSEKKFKNPLAATVAKNNAIKANPFYNSIIRY
jgi:tetratricopeptide (TPR) repeat protein